MPLTTRTTRPRDTRAAASPGRPADAAVGEGRLSGARPGERPPPVAVNGRFMGRRWTGVERYSHEVLSRLPPGVRVLRAPEAGGAAGHAWEQAALPLRLRRGELLWSPANTGPLAVSRQVATIHDLAPLDHPEWFRPPFSRWYRALLPRLARRARRVVTVSEFSRRRIVERLGLRPEHVVVAPGGVDPDRFRPRPRAELARVREKYGLPPVYLLAVGSLDPRKNLDTLVAAWAVARRGAPELGLVLAGAPSHTSRRTPGRTATAEPCAPGYVDEADLPALYGGALAFVMPSFYEGFGLPLLEAMASGTPVVGSAAAAIPEVVGEAGLLFDPRSEAELAAALDRLLTETGLRERLARRGLRRAAEYTWHRTARRVWATLLEAAGG